MLSNLFSETEFTKHARGKVCCAAQWRRGHRRLFRVDDQPPGHHYFEQRGHACERSTKPRGGSRMATSIRLVRGAFGHVSVLNVASDFVTHAHSEAHIILWLDGAAGRDDRRRQEGRAWSDNRCRNQFLPAAQPRAFGRRQGGTVPRLLHRSRMVPPPPRRAGRADHLPVAVHPDRFVAAPCSRHALRRTERAARSTNSRSTRSSA